MEQGPALPTFVLQYLSPGTKNELHHGFWSNKDFLWLQVLCYKNYIIIAYEGKVWLDHSLLTTT